MRNVLFLMLLITCVSAIATPAPEHLATYSVAIDGLSLTVRLQTRNEVGRPIVACIVLKNDNDTAAMFWGDHASPFYTEIYDEDGKAFPSPSCAVDAPQSALLPHSSISKQFDLSQDVRAAGHYRLTVSRPLNETDNEKWQVLELKGMSFYVGKPDNPNQTKN